MRPVCVHCGKSYGQRKIEIENVRWDAPSVREALPRSWKGEEMIWRLKPDAKAPPPPPYCGNRKVVKETDPYLSGADGRMVMQRYTWDGESYWAKYRPFCTLRCALSYARKAYGKEKLLKRMPEAAE